MNDNTPTLAGLTLDNAFDSFEEECIEAFLHLQGLSRVIETEEKARKEIARFTEINKGTMLRVYRYHKQNNKVPPVEDIVKMRIESENACNNTA